MKFIEVFQHPQHDVAHELVVVVALVLVEVVEHVTGFGLLHNDDDAVLRFVSLNEGRELVLAEFLEVDDLVDDDGKSVLDLANFFLVENF